MGKVLVIKGADFSANALPISKIEGTPGYTLIPSIGSGNFTINSEGFCLLDDIVTPNEQGRFALGDYNADVNDITKIRACWDVQASGITSFTQLFCRIKNLTELDCSGLNTSGITDFTHCFRYASAIEHIDLSTWTTNKQVAIANFMFDSCTALKTIDLGLIELSSTAYANIFLNCPNLIKVRTHQTNSTLIGYIAADLNAANAGGSSNWVQGTDTDGVAMLTPSV